MMAGAREDSQALFAAGIRAALETWPALQVSAVIVNKGEMPGTVWERRLKLGPSGEPLSP